MGKDSTALVPEPGAIYTGDVWSQGLDIVASPPKQRREVFYSGNVQGVGFRYTTQRLAARHDVSGYVRNLPDRRVQVVVEGSNSEVRAFLEDVARAMEAYIRASDVRELDATGEFDGFDVRF
jgi:acylphosphatase